MYDAHITRRLLTHLGSSVASDYQGSKLDRMNRIVHHTRIGFDHPALEKFLTQKIEEVTDLELSYQRLYEVLNISRDAAPEQPGAAA